jgi:hypothetical protein
MLLAATQSRHNGKQLYGYRRALLSPDRSSKGIVHFGTVLKHAPAAAAAAAAAAADDDKLALPAVQQQPLAVTCIAAVRWFAGKLVSPSTPTTAAAAAVAAGSGTVAVARGPNGAVQLLRHQQHVSEVATAADGSGGVRWAPVQQQQQQQNTAAPTALLSADSAEVAAKPAVHPTVMQLALQQRKPRVNPDSFWVQQQLPAPSAARNTAAALPRTAAAVAGRRQLLQEASGGLSQTTPDVWTHLIWAVQRSGAAADSSGVVSDSSGAAVAGGVVELADSQLLLPQPEFARLVAASRSSSDGSFSLPLIGELMLWGGGI